MKTLIKKILKESINTKVTNLILNNLKSGRIKPPLFYESGRFGIKL